jgi:glutamate-1-semialdehyde 2,1-aminomutase
METKKSVRLFEEAKRFFPGGVNSPVRAFRSVGGTPLFIEKGKGARIWDADGNTYLDYCCSWGPLILGHADDKVLSAVKATMENGTSFGAPTRLENELAALIIGNNRFVEKIRFVSSGTEAVMSAIRLARGHTKRNKILKFEGCYHGHVDALLVKAGSGLVTLGNSSSAGIPEAFVRETISIPLNDEAALAAAFKEHAHDLAAVIIEPVPANNGLLLQEKSFLQKIRELCTAHGAVLIFDEVISGFRIGFEGAAAHYGVTPDLVTYGKIIGGGFPVGAYGGKAEIMKNISPEGDVYQAGTLSGNPVAMSAGMAQLRQLLAPGFYGELEKKCLYLKEGLEKIFRGRNIKVQSIGSIFWIAFTNKEVTRSAAEIDPASMHQFRILYHELLGNGVYLGPSGYEVGFVSAAHTYDDLDHTIIAFEKSLNKLN